MQQETNTKKVIPIDSLGFAEECLNTEMKSSKSA